ncbi:YadA C-terminal domain-containing protein [uncultured Fusobacterium sp.]|uniref:YadA C-terminal domain-containing protein n=1 Tax=uncultured Fusobacterium sp. TaxID=159267 RepID=UPI00265DD59F|nr:YadA-like family protein [uncultured Fusobacterium sp.]
MKKKLFVVALMATLSTIGYGFELTHESVGFGTEDQGSNYEKVDKNFGDVKDKLTQVESVLGNLEYKDTELENEIKDLNDTLFAEGTGVLGNLEATDKDLQNQINGKADKDYVDGKVTELGDHVREEMDTVRGEIGGVKAEVYENKENIAANKTQIDKNTQDITALQDKFAEHEGRISGLEKKVDNLDNKMNKGFSLMAAMNAVDFQNVQAGEMALGAGIGHYGNAQSVALGVAYSPVEDLTVNAKYSVTAGDVDSFALGAGATYKFKVGR